MCVETRPAEVAGTKRIVSEIFFSHSDSDPRRGRTPQILSRDCFSVETRHAAVAFTVSMSARPTMNSAVLFKTRTARGSGVPRALANFLRIL
jgi:hypothetical protein